MESCLKPWGTLKSESGISLIGALVTIGIMGILSVGMMTTIDNMSKSQNLVEFKSQADNLHNEIRAHLSQSAACTATLTGVSLVPLAKTNLTVIKNGDGSDKYLLNTTLGDRTTLIGSMHFQYISDTAPSTTTGTGEIVFNFDAQRNVLGPSRLQPRSVAIQITKTPAGVLVSCVALAKMSDGLWQRSMVDTNKIYYDAGNVGIGTTNPLRKLQIESDGSESATYTGVGLRNTASGGRWWELLVSNTATGWAPANSGAITLYDRTAAAHRVMISPLGNVGIGSNSPQAKLDVAGEIKLRAATAPCSSTMEGAIQYNSGIKTFEGCDGVSWKPLGGGLGNTCRWVNSNVDCTTGVYHQAACAPGEYVNQVRTIQICYIADSTYTTVSDLYCCR
jgi:type II secretory pathway pseudopilin PulG